MLSYRIASLLDRFDSMLFTLPVVYYLALVLQPWG